MKRLLRILPLLALALLPLTVASGIVYACPWYDPLCATPTSTPTPTTAQIQKIIQINPNLIKNIQLAGTNTPTLTPTSSPKLTSTPTPTVISITETSITSVTPVVATSTPEMTATQAPTVTITAAPQQTLIAGFTKREILFGVIVIVVLILLVVQGNWAKIKAWMHKKTE